MDLLLWAYISIVLISYIGDQYQLFPLQTNITSIEWCNFSNAASKNDRIRDVVA